MDNVGIVTRLWAGRSRGAVLRISGRVASCLLVALAGCGGGGGGNGGSNSGRRSADYGIRVVHTAIDGAPVTMTIDDQPVENYRVNFGEIGPLVAIGAGDHQVVVKEVGTGVSRSVKVSVEKKERLNLLFTDQRLTVIPLSEPTPVPRDNSCTLSVLHGVDGVTSLRVAVDGESVATLLPAKISPPIVLTEGSHVVSVSGTGVQESTTMTCSGERSMVASAGGLVGYFVRLTEGSAQ